MRRPLLIYDADCGFCRRWVARWRARTGRAVRYAPLQRPGLLARHRIPRADARRAVQLVEPSGARYQGAEAVFRTLERAPALRAAARLGRLPVVRFVAAVAYKIVARHRRRAARIDRLLFGRSTAAPSRRLVRWLFLRGLGAVYLIAFASLERQVLGLYGRRGIRPAVELLQALRANAGPDAYRLAPSLLWLGSSDRDLVRLCRAGQASALALALGIAPRLAVAASWALYLSFVSVGGEFLSFQWDALLLESGLHAALVAPAGLRPGLGRRAPAWASSAVMRWLVFRLHFQSGLVKLRSRDPAWRGCTACTYHYETQPLPTPLGWYAHHLPRWFQRFSTAVALGIELGVPFVAFAPRRARRLACGVLGGLQALIALTGNYAFFNVLTLVLDLWLLDDEALGALPPPRARRARTPGPARQVGAALAWTPVALASVLAFVLSFVARAGEGPLPRALERLVGWLDPLRSVNAYGLFAVMTTERPEIVVEGSDDGERWREYRFRHKPSAPEQPPRWVAPHQPRLDWQMWFAALGPPPRWFARFLARLLEGSPDVLALLGENPFPDGPPRFVRALLYEYRVTDLETRRRTGAWWRRELVGTYFPASALR